MAKPAKTIQAPKGTRDLYPEDVLKRRYIQNAWRDASLRCGFDEIEGPTFESTDLYSIKSGQGILNELFQTFSGKGGQETLDKLVERGQADFALRPEFTPTLARMYAARARQLPKPCKWFTAGPYFRAERPQRGRLREFLQWNCDIIGDVGSPESKARMDIEIFEVAVSCVRDLGLLPNQIAIAYNDRRLVEAVLIALGLPESRLPEWLTWIDNIFKGSPNALVKRAYELGATEDQLGYILDFVLKTSEEQQQLFLEMAKVNPLEAARLQELETQVIRNKNVIAAMAEVAHGRDASKRAGLDGWGFQSNTVVRGLAYYTGLVFELHTKGERAVAGGGRYDNLIELMGGPPTPAVGFAMGDVVLTNLLEDNNLIPDGPELMEAVSRKQASIRPQAFIAVPNDDEENKAAAQSLAAALRRGQESETYLARDDRKPWNPDRYTIPPLHTRTSYKSTTNPGKLRKDADSQHAKYFVEIHGDNKVELTDMDKHESITSPTHGSFSINPADPNYVGAALDELMR